MEKSSKRPKSKIGLQAFLETLVKEEKVMQRGMLTTREEELLHTLLMQRGITNYELIEIIDEGKSLPGSTYPCEMESMSGMVVTPVKIYTFWLDWNGDHYTLGEEDGSWAELEIEELGRDRDKVIQIQQKLKQRRRIE